MGPAIFDSRASARGQKLDSELGPHMAEVECEVDNKIARERRQAEKMATMSLRGISQAVTRSYARRTPGSQVLNSKLMGESFVGLGVMVSSLDRWLPGRLCFVLGGDTPDRDDAGFQ